MRKFLIKTVLFVIPILLFITGVNSYSWHKYNTGDVEREMVKNILNDKYITNLAQYNDRLFQKLIVEQKDSLPREIVLGSSRSMQLTHEFATLKPFYNSSVYGGQINDMLAIYNIYEENNAPIERIILNVDPWIFKEDDIVFSCSYPLQDQYFKMCEEIGTKPRYRIGGIDILIHLISLKEFFSSLRSLYRPAGAYEAGAVLFKPTTDSLGSGETEYLDGSYSVFEQERNHTREELLAIDADYHINKKFTAFNQSQVREFENFVLYLKNKGVHVVLLFAPFHPLVYERSLTKDKMSLKTERYVKTFAANNNIETLGSYNPHLYNLEVIEFLNGGHPKKTAFYSIFNTKKVTDKRNSQ